MIKKLSFYVFIIASFIAVKAQTETVKVTFIANSGFLLKFETKKIILDGIYSEGYGIFTVPSNDILNKERNAISPFDNLNMLLVSHYHADHINPDYVIEHLIKDSSAVLVSTSQVDSLLENKQNYSLVKDKINSVTPVSGSKIDTTIKDVHLKIMSFTHNNDLKNEHKNLGFIINSNQFRIFHPGDAQADNPDEFKNPNLAEDSIDIAFLPYWFFDSEKKGKEIIDYLKPKAIVIIHVRINQSDLYKTKVKDMVNIPPVYFMDTTMQEICFQKSDGKLSVLTSIKSTINSQLAFYCSQNYPNPFNASTTIEYSMPENSFVNLEVFSILGSKVAVLVNDFKNAGNYKINFNAGNLASGIYYFRLKANNNLKTGKMILIK